MSQHNELDLELLTKSLLQSISEYGNKSDSVKHYRTACRSIIGFANQRGKTVYYSELPKEYTEHILEMESSGTVSHFYRQFHSRTIRLLSSLAEIGVVDFSRASSRYDQRYAVSPSSLSVINSALDYHSLHGESRNEMMTVMRHFFKYAEEKTGSEVSVTDELLLEFFTNELPKTNAGSMGRSLRAIKYLSAYLKETHTADLKLDFSQLNARQAHIRVIPPYSQKDISDAVKMIDTSTCEGLRDRAIMLLAFDTGLRGVDIRTLRLDQVNWKKGIIQINQSKTKKPLTLPLSGKAMNAVADYILNARPECDCSEIFLTFKGPAKPLEKRHYSLSRLCDKYFNKAEVEKIPGRGFHSLRRSFATELSASGVPLETISQMLGHKRVEEDKPYLSYNTEQVRFCAMGFEGIRIKQGIYSGGVDDET